MRRLGLQVFSALAFTALSSAGCVGPGALLPLAARSLAPEEQTVALPTDDGSHYVLVEARPRTTDAGLARKWNRTAGDACRGDYLVLSSGTATRRSGGVSAMRIQEGWVRCVSPEAITEPQIRRGEAPEQAAEPAPRPKAAPKAFAL